MYKGCINHKGTIHPGEQPAIVDVALWDKLNQTLAFNGSRQSGRNHHRQEALLRQIARCGQCGAELKPTFTTKRGQRHLYYVCARGRKQCRQGPMAAQDLESSLRERLEGMQGDHLSAVAIQQSIERVSYTSSKRIVEIALRDGTRFEYGLAVPNRRGVRGSKIAASGRVPRISKLMALAIKIDHGVKGGKANRLHRGGCGGSLILGADFVLVKERM